MLHSALQSLNPGPMVLSTSLSKPITEIRKALCTAKVQVKNNISYTLIQSYTQNM